MGRIQGIHPQGLMTACEIAIHILDHCKSIEAFEAYMFGSTLHGVGNDVDILIVGPRGEKLSLLKDELFAAGKELPLDILYMDPSEALETDFVIAEGCVELSFLAYSK